MGTEGEVGGLRDMRWWWRWWGGGSQPRAPSARNNKQAFSYSNKYQASGEHGGAADKEEARGERQTGGWLLCYTEASLGSRARPRRAKQAVTDL